MCAIARDLDLSLPVFAALAAVGLVICYRAPASRVRALLLFSFCHAFFFLFNERFESRI
jgi:hypothetical protein